MTPDPRVYSSVARSISLYCTPRLRLDHHSSVTGGLKTSGKKYRRRRSPGLQNEKEKKNDEKGGGVERVAQVDTFSAPTSFRISTSLSIFFS
jgi:hypothetical protein